MPFSKRFSHSWEPVATTAHFSSISTALIRVEPNSIPKAHLAKSKFITSPLNDKGKAL